MRKELPSYTARPFDTVAAFSVLKDGGRKTMDTDMVIDTASVPAETLRKRNLWRVERPMQHRHIGPPLLVGDMLEFVGLRPCVPSGHMVWRFVVVASGTVRLGKRVRVSNRTVRLNLSPVEVED